MAIMEHKETLLSAELQAIAEARHHDPFAVLGIHPHGQNRCILKVFQPHCRAMWVYDKQGEKLSLERIGDSDFFQWLGDANQIDEHYLLEWIDDQGSRIQNYHAYAFAPQVSDVDLYLFGEGRHRFAYNFLGANPRKIDAIEGILFSVWAPNAERVSVVGDFNRWDGRCHAMRNRGSSGVWELFVPSLNRDIIYKFEIRSRHGGQIHVKSDPYGKYFELRPKTASLFSRLDRYDWQDEEWMANRQQNDIHTPMSIYEVHLGSWRRKANDTFLDYDELAEQLVDYVQEMGFTHIELLPITEHPLDDSWGYQTTGYFAPTSRFGQPDDFRRFVDYCHLNNIGVLLDWAPAHFPKDPHSLARFDGTALYEHEDPRLGEHRDWGTLIFNYGRPEVRSFLISSALYWLKEFHIDGLRVDAVASMLYLDYSREEGDWLPNKFGGRENLEAIEFLRELNIATHSECPGTFMMAEESTDWPMVSRPTWLGGLGFTMKWNMGWMHDTLEYFKLDPVYRHYHHDGITFSLIYAFTENFILPFSHDEVVHGKQSILNKLPGDEWQRFANLRLLYTYMFTHPGKKLLFMGNELGQGIEWNFRQQLDWYLLDYDHHRGIQTLVKDLNRIYKTYPQLYRYDFEEQGFEWIDCHDAGQSILSYIRRDGEKFFVIVLNFTPVPRHDYRIGVPKPGVYKEIFNSDSQYYGGTNLGNVTLHAEPQNWMNKPNSLVMGLPPLGAIILSYDEDE